jgi:hypothetical protein
MAAGAWFWIIFVICVIFGLWGSNPWRPATAWGVFGSAIVVFVLLGLLGYHVFGSPLR